jgi:hypothetical protein
VTVRASLTEPVNLVGTKLFWQIYGFGPNRAQNQKHGPTRKRSLGARETPRTPRIKRVRGGEFSSQTLLPSAVPLPPPPPLASSDEQSSSPQPPIRSPPPRDGVPWRLRRPCRGIGRRRLAAVSACLPHRRGAAQVEQERGRAQAERSPVDELGAHAPREARALR